MDLVEQDFKNYDLRHPWELARFQEFLHLLRDKKGQFKNLLDYGSGDCWLASNLAKSLAVPEVCFVDSNFTKESTQKIQALVGENLNCRFEREASHQKFDLVCLLDVLEHVESDSEFLKNIVQQNFSDQTLGLISVPAFQSLYGYHDKILKHHRRYSPAQAKKVLESACLSIESSGFMFATLVVPRFVENLCAKVGLIDVNKSRLQVDSKPGVVDHILTALLKSDRTIQSLVRHKIPGLSWWALCHKINK